MTLLFTGMYIVEASEEPKHYETHFSVVAYNSCSAHEYTTSNAKFAISVEPNNPDLVERVAIVKSKRARDEPTVPMLLGEEKKANPFLRVDISDEIRRNVGVVEGDSPSVAFGKLRRAKDTFR